jgi:hypothetical protein
MIGIICDLKYTRHHLFKSYYHSVKNIYGQIPKVVNSIQDLKGLQILFIGDDHYGPHKTVWQSKDFIEYCNINGIQVVVMTNESIVHTYFPWNLEDLKKLNRFKYLYHYGNDGDDCRELGLKLNRTAPSIWFKSEFIVPIPKKDKIVFIGKIECPKNSYQSRKQLLTELQKIVEVDVIESNIPSWQDYVTLIAGYRFVLSPLGNGNFFPMRFYEALAVGSIPIHQVKKDTLETYWIESQFDDCIFFEHPNELKVKIQNCKFEKSYNMFWMEENLKMNLIKDQLYDGTK